MQRIKYSMQERLLEIGEILELPKNIKNDLNEIFNTPKKLLK